MRVLRRVLDSERMIELPLTDGDLAFELGFGLEASSR